ncbi:haloalkane dehalogenase [Aestuariivita sp.]|jgi:haloalkane dehalogenase|uniref:haloalkane dehalogenase n=1 Tax=Aestuariivita sp. TaxID=1872407 RepID=UPI00216CA32F|nr:haloalkane dehalogenase [Aestuariivita sp.]MCE8006338.1 haloalkane dehalogenase [Aestuariivita sp.]
MQYLRTPDSRFEGLKDYPFAPHYVALADGDGGSLRMHYLDEGPSDAPAVLCLHGEPSWSYLYRHMIPVFTKAGHRVLAPDLIGFGKSDKPTERSDYTYQRHVDWMTEWLTGLDLHRITLVCQDWGGLIGLRLVAAMPDRFDRVVTANTALPIGDQPMGEAFEAWRAFSQEVEIFPAGRIIYGGTTSKIDGEEIAAYDAPYPDERYKAGARQFPMLVPSTPDDPASAPNRAAWEVLRGFDKPWLTAFGADDKVMAGIDRVFQKMIPGAAGQPHTILPEAGHFLQEDVGPELAALITAFISATR